MMRKPRDVAVCSHNTHVGTGVLDGPKKPNNYRNERRMRCSKFVPRKRRTPHPPLSWSPFSRWRRLTKKANPSRIRTKFAVFSKSVGRWLAAAENKRLPQRKRREGKPLPYDEEIKNLAALRFVRAAPKPSPVGKVPRNEADEVLEICTAKTADTSSVLPYGNPPSPAGEGLRRKRKPHGYAQNSPFSQNR